MNDFSSTESSPGLLKNSYGDTGLSEALKKKREKLAKSRIGLETEDEKEKEDG